MVANLDKTNLNTEFHELLDFLTGSQINYALLVNPDVIGPWVQEFWATADVGCEGEDWFVKAVVAGHNVKITEAQIRADLQFQDEEGTACFSKQVIWDTLRDLGYEGDLTKMTFAKPLFSPQWKCLIHILLHCLSNKSTAWNEFPKAIASALVGLATNQPFNFSWMILNGMLSHVKNNKPFLMYPRFIQVFLNKQLEGVPKPQDFLPTVTLPDKVFTFMATKSALFSGHLTPLTPYMLEVAQTVRDADAEDTEVASEQEDSAPTPSQRSERSSSPTKDDSPQETVQKTASDEKPVSTEHTVSLEDIVQEDPDHGVNQPFSPNDYTSTDGNQTSGGDEGVMADKNTPDEDAVMDNYALTRELRRLKKAYDDQTAQLLKLRNKFKRLKKSVWPLITHHRLWVKSQKKHGQHPEKVSKSKKRRLRKLSSFTLGRNQEDVNLNEEVEEKIVEERTGDQKTVDQSAVDQSADIQDVPVFPQTPLEEDNVKDQDDAEQENLHNSDDQVRRGDTEVLDLEDTGVHNQGTGQGTGRQFQITPRTLDFEEDVGPSNPVLEEDVNSEDNFTIAEIMLNMSKPRSLTIPGAEQPQEDLPPSPKPIPKIDPKDKGKGILEEPEKKKKKKFSTIEQIRAYQEAQGAIAAKKLQAELDAEYEQEKLKAADSMSKKSMTKAQERNWFMSYLKGQGYKGLTKLNHSQMKDLYEEVRAEYQRQVDGIVGFDTEEGRKLMDDSNKRKRATTKSKSSKKSKLAGYVLNTGTTDELKNYLRLMDFDLLKPDFSNKSKISDLEVVESKKDGVHDYFVYHREDKSYRAFTLLIDILHLVEREDLYDIYAQIQTYFEDNPLEGVGLMLLGDLTTMWETDEASTDEFWKNQDKWEIHSWRFFASAGVHVLELEDGTMIYMLAEKRYPLTRDIMIRMLDHGLEVQSEDDVALMVINLFINWTILKDD